MFDDARLSIISPIGLLIHRQPPAIPDFRVDACRPVKVKSRTVYVLSVIGRLKKLCLSSRGGKFALGENSWVSGNGGIARLLHPYHKLNYVEPSHALGAATGI